MLKIMKTNYFALLTNTAIVLKGIRIFFLTSIFCISPVNSFAQTQKDGISPKIAIADDNTKAIACIANSPSGLNSYDSGSCVSTTVQWTNIEKDNVYNYYLDVSTATDFSSFLPYYNNKNLGTVYSETITGLSNGMTYYYRLRASNFCGTSANANASFKVGSVGGTTSANQSICATETPTDISLTGYQGTIQWQVSTEINTSYKDIPEATESTLKIANSGSAPTKKYYHAILKYGSCTLNNSTEVRIISSATPTTAAAGIDQSTCDYPYFTMAANQPKVGTAAWSVISGTATVVTTNKNSSAVRDIHLGTSATLRWTITNGTCPSSTDDVILTNYQLTKAEPGPAQSNCNVSTFNLAANQPIIGTGTWSLMVGKAVITDPNLNNSGVTGLVAGNSATLRWTITNGACSSSKDVLLYNDATPSTATAGPDQSGCTTFTLAANDPATNSGIGVWSLIEGTATITTPSSRVSQVTDIPPESSAILRWTISNGTCTPSFDELILYNYSTAAKAGTDQINCNSTTFTLAANQPIKGSGIWTLVNGTATITKKSIYNSTVTAVPSGSSATLRWTYTEGSCTSSTDDVTIYNYAVPTTAAPGANQNNCNNSNFTLAANSVANDETGLWSLINGAATISSPSSPNSPASIAEGTSATLQWTITKIDGGCSSSNQLVLANNTTAAPSAEEQTFCTGATVTDLLASGTLIQWYLDPTAGTALIDTTLLSTANYYASQTLNNCESNRTAVAISVYNKTWIGNSSTAWNTAANWTPAIVPTAKDCVVIPGGTTFKTILESGDNALVYSLLIKNSGDLSIASGLSITLIDKLTVEYGGLFSVADAASLVQVANESSNLVEGTFTATRNSQFMKTLDYTYWGSPINAETGKTLSDLFSGANHIYSWMPSVNKLAGNWNREEMTALMNPNLGYIVRAQSDGIQTVVFKGTPNNGNIELAISHGDLGPSTDNDKWNLIANPYLSAVDADAFLAENNAIDGTIYFWTHNTPMAAGAPSPFYQNYAYNYSSDDYASYNGVGGTATCGGTNSKNDPENHMTKPDGSIASGTGFFVKSLANESATATFKNSMRNAAISNSQFFKTTQNPKIKSPPQERHRIWLNLVDKLGGFSQTLIGYLTRATLGRDRDFDGTNFGGNGVRLYSITPEGDLSIQGRPIPFLDTDKVRLGYIATADSNLTLLLDEIDGLFLNQNIYLEDKLLNTIHDMKENPYVFTSTAGTFDDRFLLRYNTNTLANTNFNSDNNLSAFVLNKELKVSASQAIAEIRIYELTGKEIDHFINLKILAFKCDFRFAKGIYLAKIKLENGLIFSKKIMN